MRWRNHCRGSATRWKRASAPRWNRRCRICAPRSKAMTATSSRRRARLWRKPQTATRSAPMPPREATRAPPPQTPRRAQGVGAASARGGGSGGGFSGDTFSDIFGDVFGDIFGGARRGGRSQVFRGADLRYELQLELPQAVFGHQVEIEIPRLAECEVCHGSGAAKG